MKKHLIWVFAILGIFTALDLLFGGNLKEFYFKQSPASFVTVTVCFLALLFAAVAVFNKGNSWAKSFVFSFCFLVFAVADLIWGPDLYLQVFGGNVSAVSAKDDGPDNLPQPESVQNKDSLTQMTAMPAVDIDEKLPDTAYVHKLRDSLAQKVFARKAFLEDSLARAYTRQMVREVDVAYSEQLHKLQTKAREIAQNNSRTLKMRISEGRYVLQYRTPRKNPSGGWAGGTKPGWADK